MFYKNSNLNSKTTTQPEAAVGLLLGGDSDSSGRKSGSPLSLQTWSDPWSSTIGHSHRSGFARRWKPPRAFAAAGTGSAQGWATPLGPEGLRTRGIKLPCKELWLLWKRNKSYLICCGVLGSVLCAKWLGVLASALFLSINSSVVPERHISCHEKPDWLGKKKKKATCSKREKRTLY